MSQLLNPLPAPTSKSFEGSFITLRPLSLDQDAEELYKISHFHPESPKLWQYLPCGPFETLEEYVAFLRDWSSKSDLIVYTVRDTRASSCLGSISLMSVRPEHGVAELGNIWYAPAAQRTKTNTESCYLLLRYCFEELGYRRMEWKCNTLNEPSRKAALRLGFTFEGTFRQHMIVKGLNRDTAWFSILDHEWPRIANATRHWLYEDDSLSLVEQLEITK